MDLDIEWDVKLYHRKGGETRLCGIDVFYDFKWLDVFPDRRTQFRNGQCLAKFVQDKCPSGKTPALLLTLRPEVKQGLRHTPNFLLCVVNLPEYTSTDGNAATSYIATHLAIDVADIDQLNELASTADPEVFKAFIESHLDFGYIAAWVADNEERLQELGELVASKEGGGTDASVAEIVAALDALGELNPDEVALIAALFGPGADREQRLELLRAVTKDPTGRYVTGEVLAERTPQRIQDARDAMAAYQALLADETTTETMMQKFIEENLWLLGLDYARMRARKTGPSGAMDFLLERYDGFHDLLELKSPQDPLITAPDIAEGDPVPPPHDYALSKSLAQALAQAIVYRDRLTRFSDSAEELYGLPHTRDPRLIIVVGKADSLPDHRRRVLQELNKSLHRVEVVPYDILAKRAEAVLANVERYLVAADEAAGDPTEQS